MTLIPYLPAELDRLALRMLDLAADVRRIAQRQREHELDAIPLHGNKIQEWLERLETWSHDAKSRADVEINKHLGARRARELLRAESPRAVPPKTESSTVAGPRKRRRKK